MIFKNLLSKGFLIISLFPLLPLKSNNNIEKSCKNEIKKELKNLTLEKTKSRAPKTYRTKVIDINDDQRKEILIEKSFGGDGNCCPPTLEIVYFNSSCRKKEYQFKHFDSVWGGWESVNIKKVKDDFIISATNNAQGYGYRDLDANNVEYIFNGKTLNFHSKTTKKETKAIAEIRTSKLKKNMPDHQETFLMIDLNSDKRKEKISCNYWDRWGTFTNCLIKQDETNLKIGQNINPKRLGVLEEKKNGWNLLVIDHNEKYFFNAYKKRYEKF